MRPMSLFARFGLVLTLLAAACGGATPGVSDSELVADVLAAAELPEDESTTTTTLPPGCRTVTETDEYGFEVETTVCDGTAVAQPAKTPWLGSEESREVASRLREIMLNPPVCGEPVAHARLRAMAAEAAEKLSTPLIAAIAAMERGALHCDVDPAAWMDSMEEAIDHLGEFLDVVAAIDAERARRAEVKGGS